MLVIAGPILGQEIVTEVDDFTGQENTYTYWYDEEAGYHFGGMFGVFGNTPYVTVIILGDRSHQTSAVYMLIDGERHALALDSTEWDFTDAYDVLYTSFWTMNRSTRQALRNAQEIRWSIRGRERIDRTMTRSQVEAIREVYQ